MLLRTQQRRQNTFIVLTEKNLHIKILQFKPLLFKNQLLAPGALPILFTVLSTLSRIQLNNFQQTSLLNKYMG